jgi:hypothetical protein
MTPGGNAVLGEPAPTKADPKAQPARDPSHYDPVERFDEVAAKLSKFRLPEVQPMTLGLIGGIVLLSALGYWFFSKQSIETRSRDVARAILRTDMKLVIDLSAPGTEMDSIRWYGDVYKRYMNLKNALGSQDPGVTITPKAEAKGGASQVNVLFSKAGTRFDGSLFSDALHPNPSFANAEQSFEVPLFWVTDIWGNWLLDGTKTFAGSATP